MAGAVRRVAGLGVRLDGLHDLRAGPATRAARPAARTRRRIRHRRVIGWYGGIIFSIFLIGWAIGGVLFGVLADHFGTDQGAGFHDPDLRRVHRHGGAVADLVATGAVPVHHGAGHRRRMGGGRGAGGGGVAGGQTGQGRGPVAIGLGGGISHGGNYQSAPARLRLAAHVRGRHRAGGRRVLRLLVGQGTGAMGQGPRRGTAGRRRASVETGGTVCAGAGALHTGRLRAGVCGRVRFVGRDELDADARPRACRICRA